MAIANESGDDRAAQEQRDAEVLRRACLSVLAGNFDAVQIVATKHDAENGSTFACWGEGNYYARLGATNQWLVVQKKNAP